MRSTWFIMKRLSLSQHCFKGQKSFLEKHKNHKFPSLYLPKKAISAKKRIFHCFCTETKNSVIEGGECLHLSQLVFRTLWMATMASFEGWASNIEWQELSTPHSWMANSTGLEQGTLLMGDIWTFIDSNLSFLAFFYFSEENRQFWLCH